MKKFNWKHHLLIFVVGILLTVLVNEGLKVLISSERIRLVVDLIIFYCINGSAYGILSKF